MPTTPNPIDWEFVRNVGQAKNVGIVLHQYDTNSQSIYLKDGLKTKIATIDKGKWINAIPGEEQIISDTSYYKIAFDQPFQNQLSGVAIIGTKLIFLQFDGVQSLVTDQDPN